MSKDQLTIWLAGSLAELSIKHINKLLTQFTDVHAVWQVCRNDLQQMGLTFNQAQRLQAISKSSWDNTWRWADQSDCHLVAYNDPYYPDLLKQIANPPPVLYVQGQKELLASYQLSIVGTRYPTAQGRKTAELFARDLANSGWIVTSGLAFGIDIAAHKGALQYGYSIAVLATGLDVVYPASHQQQANAITQAGALVSEMPLGTPPKHYYFPRRNRLISGLSQGVLIIEAANKSGSLHTARYAVEQNREVFAVPGSIHNPQSKGCHKLIKQGAKLVESVEDITEEWPAQLSLWSQVNTQQATHSQQHEVAQDKLNDKQQNLLKILGYEPLTLDEISEWTQHHNNRSSLLSDLMQLELEGYIQSVPGGYVRC